MTVNILPRTAWNAAPPRWQEKISSSGVFIHYNGPEVGRNILAGDYESVASFIKNIQSFHMGPSRGWPDLAYSFIVDSVGRAWTGRGWGVAGAHTLNHNWSSHAIFLPLGGNQQPTEAQIATCRLVVEEHNRRFGVGFVRGHREVNSTSCPGDPVMARIAEFASGAAAPQPVEPDEDDDMAKQIMIRDDRTGTVWNVDGNTRYRLEPPEVELLRYLGVQLVDRRGADNASSVTWLRSCKDLGRPK
jgi:hypothetical protein